GLHDAQPPIKKNPPAEPGFEIPAATRQRILERLAGAESENNVRILYACESGSRAWGFASRDSDFDVRFIYVHPPEWYLSVAPEERRDVIELGIENTDVGELDINGWELRKALKLFRRSNPPLFEWLSSPVVYLECGSLAPTLRELAPQALSPLGAWHHYHSLMRKSRSRYWEKRRSVKALFYMLRPLMAMRWLELGHGVPPMRFDLLVDGVVEDAGTRQAIRELVELKRLGGEQQAFTPDEHLVAYFERLMPASEECAPLAPTKTRNDVDGVFRAVLDEAFPFKIQ
nr:nucleotidyltransferase domain-containing protein [Desulfovibrio sp.]